jgi:large subunit ribosomal protein L29
MAAEAYRNMSEEELLERVAQLRQSLFNLRVRNTTKELENTSRLRLERKELARVLTALSLRRKTQAPAAEAPVVEEAG